MKESKKRKKELNEKERKKEVREDIFWKILVIFFLILILFSVLFVSMRSGYDYYQGKPWYIK